MDAHDSFEYSESGQTSLFHEQLRNVCQRSRFDVATGSWLYFASETERATPRRELEAKAVAFVLEPLVKVLLGRRWEVAALSRWTGVAAVLKRTTLGAALNNILPECMGSLSKELGLSGEELQKEKDKMAAAVM